MTGERRGKRQREREGERIGENGICEMLNVRARELQTGRMAEEGGGGVGRSIWKCDRGEREERK